MANDARIKSPAAAQKELIAPTDEISHAPAAGPKIQATPIKPSCIPFSLSKSTFDALDTSASSVFLAV